MNTLGTSGCNGCRKAKDDRLVRSIYSMLVLHQLLALLAVFLFVFLVPHSALAQTKSSEEDDNSIAIKAYSEGDYDLAIEHLKACLNKNEQIGSNSLAAKLMNPAGKAAFGIVSGQMSPAMLLIPNSSVYSRGLILKQLGDAYFLKGDYLEAESYYKDTIGANEAREEWIFRNNTSFKPKVSPNLDDCLKACESTVRLIENKQQSQPECIFEKCQYAYSDARDSIAALHYLAIIYDLQGKFDQAEQVYHYTFPYLYQRFRETPSAWAEPYERREMINIRERCKEAIQAAKGNESPYLATRIEQIAISNYNNGSPTFTYGKIQEREQNYAMSEALFRQALAIRQIANDADDLEMLHFDLEYLRQSLAKQMKLKDASDLDNVWLATVEKAHGPTSITLAQVLIRVGGDESHAQDCKTAIMHLQRALQIYGIDQNSEIKSHHFDQRSRNLLFGAFSYLADCYKCQGMIAEANECRKRRAECVE